jgi:aryl-alcohol dehydrogenase-like predicted oxidoreductase
VNHEEQIRVITRARSLGIKLYDTADSYGQGDMERRLAEVLGTDDGLTVVTKIGTDRDSTPPRKSFSVEFLERSLDACAARQRPRTLDLVLLHNPSIETFKQGEATQFLADQVLAGRIKGWGVSAGSAAVVQAAFNVNAPVIELAYNVLWPKDLRSIEMRFEPGKTGILARSVLAHGLLAGYFPHDKVFPSFDHRSERWTGDELHRRLRHLDALRPLVHGEASSLRAVALRWVLCNEMVSSAILGPRSILQLDQLIRDAGREPPYLSPESLVALEARLEDMGARL